MSPVWPQELDEAIERRSGPDLAALLASFPWLLIRFKAALKRYAAAAAEEAAAAASFSLAKRKLSFAQSQALLLSQSFLHNHCCAL